MSLELYSKIENFLGFEENINDLHKIYLDYIKKLRPKSVLDIGCGNGELSLKIANEGLDVYGVDLSSKAIDICKSKNLPCACTELKYIDKKFDMAIAVFDVLNYIPSKKLKQFLKDVSRVLNNGGYFIADINSFYGFSQIADGDLNIDKLDKFIAISSIFADNVLNTKINYFEKENTFYKRESSSIKQYYHSIEDINNQNIFIIENIINLNLYLGEEPDKNLLIFSKK